MKLTDCQPFQSFYRLLLSTIALLTCSYSYAQHESNGEKLFSLHCETCHTFKEDGIGPQLGGLKGVLDQKYLTAFINSPQAMINAKNPRALEKYKKFGTIMPNFNHLKPKEIQELIAFILEKPAPKVTAAAQKKGLTNPIPAPIQMATISLNLKKVIQFPATNTIKPRTRINKMGVHPITKENLVADSQGKIYILNANNEPDVFFDVMNHFPKFTNVPGLATGLGSFAFHPDFAQNGLFYTTHTEPNNQVKADFAYADSIPVKLQWIINEWVIDNKTSRTVTGKPRELLRINVVTQIHGLQEIAFNPYAKPGDEDYGLMYVCEGDGGAVEQGYAFIPKRKNHVWGKVLRIDPTGRNSKNGQYGIPKSNPIGRFGLDEIYAAGFRNPNRISWTKDGKVLVTNIGQHEIESLYLLKPGKDYGWPNREGAFLIDSTGTINTVFPLPANDAQFGYTYPVAQFDHDEGNAIMGGFEYIGSQVPELKGKYIFGDVVKGRVFYVNLNEIKEGSQATIHEFPIMLDHKPTTLKELCKVVKVDFRIGQDASGELYIFTRSDGMMYKIAK
ncbi:PQQ-dependent sugar dehydrogenase [Spirosoma sp. BT702]|uniref:PQQ-dependent sugar dehydrogenase n=1 Tax=Spirosoma profusum TaxID=2771354 RepID=A0A926Y194_9BACT|nr:PQQ-dependent sugar dehydrogenase [Spirosoma profusum]MBD2704065.1 PQQ-dependent sugar dehydrogenase [Spirosoma profusum]